SALAPPGRVLDALAAARDARIVEGFNFFGAVAGKPYRTAIGVAGCFAVDWLGNAEGARRCAIKDPASGINFAFRHANGAEHGIVELFRSSNVVSADKDMREHLSRSPSIPICEPKDQQPRHPLPSPYLAGLWNDPGEPVRERCERYPINGLSRYR